jgi:hypothetical protein
VKKLRSWCCVAVISVNFPPSPRWNNGHKLNVLPLSRRNVKLGCWVRRQSSNSGSLDLQLEAIEMLHCSLDKAIFVISQLTLISCRLTNRGSGKLLFNSTSSGNVQHLLGKLCKTWGNRGVLFSTLLSRFCPVNHSRQTLTYREDSISIFLFLGKST